jgi:hypothetical protein
MPSIPTDSTVDSPDYFAQTTMAAAQMSAATMSFRAAEHIEVEASARAH